jgi:hypothetical protein
LNSTLGSTPTAPSNVSRNLRKARLLNDTVSDTGNIYLVCVRSTAVSMKLAPAMYGKMSVLSYHRKREPEALS